MHVEVVIIMFLIVSGVFIIIMPVVIGMFAFLFQFIVVVVVIDFEFAPHSERSTCQPVSKRKFDNHCFGSK